MSDIIIIPQRGTLNEPTIQFSGSVDANVTLAVSASGAVRFDSTVDGPIMVLNGEPTGSIDRESSEMFFNFVQLLNKKKGMTFFIGTHNEKFLQFATKVVYLNQGEIEKIEE